MGVETMFLHQNKQPTENELTAIEREHFGDPEKGTGIYAALASKPVPAGWKTLSIPIEWTPGPNQFKDWCDQWFGPDSDDDYLMRAVNALVSSMSSAPAQPVREPMTDEQVYDLYWPADVGGFDEVREIVRQVERHHGICKE